MWAAILVINMRRLKPREGDFIETLDHIILDVKGLVHPPERVVAFIRYVPDPAGDRRRNGETYRKVYPLAERYRLLRQKYSHYLVFDPVFNEYLNEVPIELIKRHYDPRQRLIELRNKAGLDGVESQALKLIELLKEESNIAWSKLGISGSVLVRLHRPTSDIDLIVYGRKSCLSVYETLRKLLTEKQGPLKSYNNKDLKELYGARLMDTIMPLGDFLRIEKRKVLQGKFKERNYFIRLVKDWDEVKECYGDTLYKSMGYAKIKAVVVDDSEAIFTPCRYEIDKVQVIKGKKNAPIKEVTSFRGRFCEQAKLGERIEAQGKLEEVYEKDGTKNYRLLLGGRLTDYMIVSW
jgi:predicted nucleotidyltransferase